MVGRIGNALSHVWEAFRDPGEVEQILPAATYAIGPSSSTRPDRPRMRIHSERTIVSSIYTRMAIDVAAARIEHVRLDEDGMYLETLKTGITNCFMVAANIDQMGRHFRTDIPLTLFSEGCIAIVPVETTINPMLSGSWDVNNMRVGVITNWWPKHVRVRAYNEKTGQQEDVTLPKDMVAIVENPFYSVMNEPNSTLQRLVHKLSLLDNVDEISGQGKLDIIIQLPYVVKSESRQAQAQKRVKDIQEQLAGSTYGIAYTDGTEKITQLNRSVENNLLEQVKYLKQELYNELGLTEEIMNGTADDVVMMNYMNRTIEPILDAIVEACAFKFLTKTGRTQGQSIMYFQSPFKFLPLSKLAEVVDVLSRNQVVAPNEIRQLALGLKPSQEPQASQLVNSNMPLDKQITDGSEAAPEEIDPADEDLAALQAEMADLGIE